MANQSTAEDKVIDQGTVLQAGAAPAPAGLALLRGAHAEAQPRSRGDSTLGLEFRRRGTHVDLRSPRSGRLPGHSRAHWRA